jgi:DNA-binding response OmpR family regulator
MNSENDRNYAMTTANDIKTIIASALQFRYQDAHLEIGVADKLALLDSRPLRLTRKEYELLVLLAENAGEVVPREVLLMRVWGYGSGIRTRTLDVHIRRLRRQLGSYGAPYIETIFGIGYRFQPFRASRRFQPGTPVSAIALSA